MMDGPPPLTLEVGSCPVQPAADLGRIVKSTRWATCRLTQCSEHRQQREPSFLTTIIVIGFADPARGIKNAAASVHRRAWKRGGVAGGGAGPAAGTPGGRVSQWRIG